MKFFLIILVLLGFLSGCKSAKDAFTLQKKPTTDEFLVEKKNPLVVPPDYRKLPIPISEQEKKTNSTNDDIKISLGSSQETSNEDIESSGSSSVEKSILNQIK